MRQIIPHESEPYRPGCAVESDEAGWLVVLTADGVPPHWFASDAARRIAHALLQAAGVVERASRGADGGGSAPDDELTDLY